MEENILDRALYKQIKNMNRDEMEGFLKRVFENGYKKAVDENAAEGLSVDLDMIRENISEINGIGAKRLDEIMTVISVFIDVPVKDDLYQYIINA